MSRDLAATKGARLVAPAERSESIPMQALSRVGGTGSGSGAIHGFGRLWRKVHRVGFGTPDIDPIDVIRVWRTNFGDFWPKGNQFYSSVGMLQGGEVAVLNLEMPGGTRLATGVLVLYADNESFTVSTPHGHMFAGWITYSAFKENDETVAQAEIVMRAADPLFEIGLELFGHRQENDFWEHTLRALAHWFGLETEPTTQMICLDRRRQWRYARNVWHNSAIRSLLHIGLAPIARMARRARQGQPTSRETS